MIEPGERTSSTVNSKIHSDSGYGSSNKSNSQSQRSSRSSKSQHSSLSSGSGYLPHSNTPLAEPHTTSTHVPANNGKPQGKKRNKLDMFSTEEKNETRSRRDEQEKMTNGMSKWNEDGDKSQSERMGVKNMEPQSQTPPSRRSTTCNDNTTMQVLALTHALSYMKKFQDPILADTELNMNFDSDVCRRKTAIKWQDYVSEDFIDGSNEKEDTFATVVSLDDGVVVYITRSINNILGFPKDMLLGRSFIDFLHPEDRIAFVSRMTYKHPLTQSAQGPTVKSEPFYCRLKLFRGLNAVGFGVTDKTMMYHPFKLTMQLKNVPDSKSFKEEGSVNNETSPIQLTAYLVVGATKLKSAYQYPEELPKNPGKFVTRHSASYHFSHIDPEAINYLGYLPQDLIGSCVLDYYHPEDMNILKDIYEAVMQEQGKPFRSTKPYRFRCFNGTFVKLETDWSCFINPWSLKLEFVIGQHQVVLGPMNPNVFIPPTEAEYEALKLSVEVVAYGKEMQKQIRKILTEIVTPRIVEPLRPQNSRRRKDLSELMEILLEQMEENDNSYKSGSLYSGISVLERDSIMLGEISPHTVDKSGSNQSSCTTPSYNQLNFKENMERFFSSQPKTQRSDKSRESSNKMDVIDQSFTAGNTEYPAINYSSDSNIRNFSESNESGNERTTGEIIQLGSGSLTLTLEHLTQHNENMEKCMIQKHKDSRSKRSVTTKSSNKESRLRHTETLQLHRYPLASLSSQSMKGSSKYSNPKKSKRGKSQNIKSPHCDTSQQLKRTRNLTLNGDCHTSAKQPHLEQSGFKIQPMPHVMVCQPISPIIHYPPILMPLGTMIHAGHPGQPLLMSTPTTVATAVIPNAAELSSSSGGRMGTPALIPLSLVSSTCFTTSAPNIFTAKSSFAMSVSSCTSSKKSKPLKTFKKTVRSCKRPMRKNILQKMALSKSKKSSDREPNNPSGTILTSSSSDWPGSDEDMTWSSINTTGSKIEVDQDQYISDQCMNPEKNTASWMENYTPELSLRYTAVPTTWGL